MPIYEYECQSCGKRIEALQRVSDPPLENCDCGDEGQLKKLVSAPAFQFKGDGWYVTDYARKDGAGKDSSDKDTSKDNGKKSESTGSEAKTAKATESSGTKSERISSATPPSSSSKST